MFLYYFLHTMWNQLRKLAFTWAFGLFFILCTLGYLGWLSASWYYQRLVEANPELPSDVTEFIAISGLSNLNAVELAVGLFALGILVIQAVDADKSVSRLFMQADVNLLFASDRSPQEILGFRVMNTLGLGIIGGVVLLVQLPSIASRYALEPYAAASALMAWLLLLAFSVLLKILLYEIGSRHPFFHRNLRWFIFAALAVLGAFFYQAFKRNDDDVLLTAHQFFNASWTRWIPIWGWIKATLLYALEGQVGLSLAVLGLSLALIAGLVVLVLRLPADYYEQTLGHAQEMARLREALTSEGAALLVMSVRPKRRVERDGFSHGSGSNVYFFRVLHDRWRSSRFLVTKTTITYLLTALAAGFYTSHFLEHPIDYIPVLVLATMVFFRTIISPVAADIRMAGFLLQPEPIWSKLFFSLLGGSCNCALDVALPLMAGSALAGFSPLRGLCYLPALVAVDFFASAAGAFSEVSIPNAIGTGFKQVIQILLIYVGLIFDGTLLTYGIATNHSTTGFVMVSLLNLVFGATFMGLCGVWLYPFHGTRVASPDYEPDVAGARRAYSRVGFALASMFVGIHLGQAVLAQALPEQPVTALYLPIYGIGFPLFLLLGGKVPRRGEQHALGLRAFLLLVPTCFFVMYGGNIVGLILQGLKDSLVPFHMELPVAQATEAYPLLQTALLVVAAPVMEEFVFRRCALERLAAYGERVALPFSALLFALFHGSINQVCYAFMLGLVFGVVYLRTRRLRYTIALHVGINTLGAVVLPALISLVMESMPDATFAQVEVASVISQPEVLVLLAYLALLFVLSLLGSVLFLLGVRELDLDGNSIKLRTALSSAGIIVFLVLSAGLVVLG